MAEYATTATQTVTVNNPVLFSERPVGCTCGTSHRQGSGNITLDGGNTFLVTFGANIAITTGGTPGPISIALVLDGEPLYASTATVTPAAAGDFFNVHVSAIVRTCRCCATVAVRNVSASGGTIDVANANLTVTRI